MSQSAIQRKPLLAAELNNPRVTSVDVREITLAPGQQTGLHVHPCAVFGYIVSGTALFQINGQPAQTLQAGSAFHEPAEAVIAQFSNASKDLPLTFIAFYLKDGEQELIKMLDK